MNRAMYLFEVVIKSQSSVSKSLLPVLTAFFPADPASTGLWCLRDSRQNRRCDLQV